MYMLGASTVLETPEEWDRWLAVSLDQRPCCNTSNKEQLVRGLSELEKSE